MSDLLHFSANLSHLALIFMGLVYILRIRWFLGFKAGKERQAPTAQPGSKPGRSILYSLMTVAQPWAMESTRNQWFIYVQFVVFHLGVVAAITLTFIIPYAPALLQSPTVVLVFQALIGGACLVGLIRIVRRVGSPYLRAISSPDDYFSLILLTVWFFFGYLAVPMDMSGGEWHMLSFFFMTTFFLFYVPFSKISHYLYYPFTRFYLGKSLGRRGVYPVGQYS